MIGSRIPNPKFGSEILDLTTLRQAIPLEFSATSILTNHEAEGYGAPIRSQFWTSTGLRKDFSWQMIEKSRLRSPTPIVLRFVSFLGKVFQEFFQRQPQMATGRSTFAQRNRRLPD